MTFSTASMGEIDCATIAIALSRCLAVSMQAISTILSVQTLQAPATHSARHSQPHRPGLGDPMTMTVEPRHIKHGQRGA